MVWKKNRECLSLGRSRTQSTVSRQVSRISNTFKTCTPTLMNDLKSKETNFSLAWDVDSGAQKIKMLEPGLLAVLNFCFSITTKLHAFPFHWDSTKSKFAPFSKWGKRVSIFLTVKLWLFFFFVSRQTFRRIGDGITPGKLVFVQLLEMVRLLMGCSLQTSLVVQEKEAIAYLNKLLGFHISFLYKK